MGIFSKRQPAMPMLAMRDPLDEGEYDFDVVGESRCREALLRIIVAADDRERELGEVYRLATLVREPDNPFDPNAVRVLISAEPVGYITRDSAPFVAELVDRAATHGRELAVLSRVGWDTDNADPPIGVFLALPLAPDLPSLTLIPGEDLDRARDARNAELDRLLDETDAPDPNAVDLPNPAAGPPADWYADPHGIARLRYWDGAAWTDHTSS